MYLGDFMNKPAYCVFAPHQITINTNENAHYAECPISASDNIAV